VMNKIKLVAKEAIHLEALEVDLVDSQALKGSMTNLDNLDREELEALLRLEIYSMSLRSSSADHKVEIDKEEVRQELLPEVRI